MSLNDSLLNENNLSNGDYQYNHINNIYYEISENISFSILQKYKNKNNIEINTKKENKFFNFDTKDIINSFLTKLYNNDSTLIINENNLKEIFFVFKQILSESNEFSTSIILNINNFEVKHDKNKKNNKRANYIKNNDIDMEKSKTEFVKKENKINDNNKFINSKNIEKINNKCVKISPKNIYNSNIRKYHSFNEKLFNLNKNILLEQNLKNKQKNLSYDFNNHNNIIKRNSESNNLSNKNSENSENKMNIKNNILGNIDYNNNIYYKTANSLNPFRFTKKEKETNNENKKDKKEIKVNTLRNNKSNSNNTLFPSTSQRDKLINQKIKELEEETKRFKEERNRIMNLKNEYEKLQKELFKDVEEFEIKKENFEKYKKDEMEKIKKKKIYETKNNYNTNINFNNNKLFINSKNDKEVIQLLKRQIQDLENIIKLKDDELKIHIKNKNTKGLKNNHLYNNIINIINTNKNNYTMNTNNSKNYFENINKRLSKLKIEKFMNISYTYKPSSKKLNKKENNINKNINNKSKINISFQQNNKNSKIINKKNLYGTDTKEIKRNSYIKKDKIIKKKEVPKVKLSFKPKFNEILEIEDDIGENNYIGNEELNLSKNLFFKDKNEKKVISS